MRWVRGHLAAIMILVASLLGAAGCVSVPTSGPIEKVEGQQAGLPELRERRGRTSRSGR